MASALQTLALRLFVLTCVVLVSGNVEPSYSVDNEKIEEEGKCQRRITVKGGKINQEFKAACTDKINVIASDSKLVVGDLTDAPFALYSETDDILGVVKNGKCVRKTYSQDNGKTKVSEKDLRRFDCRRLIKKITEEIEKKKDAPEPSQQDGSSDTTAPEAPAPDSSNTGTGALDQSNTGVVVPPVDQNGKKKTRFEELFEVEINTHSDKKGKCIQEIHVKGKEFEDKLTGGCFENSIITVRSDEALVVGDPEINPFALFSDNPKTLVLVKKDNCYKKTYASKGTNKGEESTLSKSDCDEIKKNIVVQKERNKEKWEQWKVNVEQEMANELGSTDATTPQHDASSDTKPEPVALANEGSQALTGHSEHSNGKISFGEQFSVSISSNINKKLKCAQVIHIKNDEFEEKIRGECFKNLISVTKSDTALVVGDLEVNPFVLYTDNPKTIILVKKDKCYKKTYGSKEANAMKETKMTPSACQETHKKIEIEKEKEKKKMLEEQHTNSQQQVTNPLGQPPPQEPVYTSPAKPVYTPPSDPETGPAGPQISAGTETVLARPIQVSPDWWPKWRKQFSDNKVAPFPPGFAFRNEKLTSKNEV